MPSPKNEYKWYLTIPPLSISGGGNILMTKAFHTFQFFTDEEKESHEFESKMCLINTDDYAQYLLKLTLEEQENNAKPQP